MSPIERELLKITATALFGKEYEICADLDYAAVLDEASSQSVYGLAYPMVRSVLENDRSAKYEELFFNYVVQNTVIESGHAAVHELMTEHRIPYVTIKGCASAKYYPDPSLRCMGDVDFLVGKQDFEKAVKLVEEQGFSLIEEDDGSHHQALLNGNTTWEVHHSVSGIPDGIVGKICRNKLSGIIEKAVLYSTDSGEFLIPDKYHHGLVILLHTTEHIASTGVGLRHICDWAVFVNSMSESTFTQMFRKDFKEIGLWHFAKVLTALCTKYLGLPEREFAKDVDDASLSDMMEDVLAGGNFGKKDADRYHASMLTSKESDDSSFVKNIFRTLNKRTRIRMPITQHIPALLPIGWAYVGVNHLKMIRKGQRPALRPKQTLEKSVKRRDLNKNYRLFEIENKK